MPSSPAIRMHLRASAAREGCRGARRPAAAPLPSRWTRAWITGTAEGTGSAASGAAQRVMCWNTSPAHNLSWAAVLPQTTTAWQKGLDDVRVGPFRWRCQWAVHTFIKSNFLALIINVSQNLKKKSMFLKREKKHQSSSEQVLCSTSSVSACMWTKEVFAFD